MTKFFTSRIDSRTASRYIDEAVKTLNNPPDIKSLDRDKRLIESYHKVLAALTCVTGDNRVFELAITTTTGGKERINIYRNSEIIINRYLSLINESLTPRGILSLFDIHNQFVENNKIKIHHRTNVIDGENKILENAINWYIESFDEITLMNFIVPRIDLVLDLIYDFDKVIYGNPLFVQDKKIIEGLYGVYISRITNALIYKDHIFQAYAFLKEELDNNDEIGIVKVLINSILDLNSKFLLEPKSNVEQILNENEHLFSEEEKLFLNGMLNTDPRNMQISDVQFAQGIIKEKEYSNVKIVTILRFSFPCNPKVKEGLLKLNNTNELHFQIIQNFAQDPVYKLYKDISIGGMGWNFFMDNFLNPEKENVVFTLGLPDFYHPDFEFDANGDPKQIDFKEKEALIGRHYYPYKELIIKQLLDNREIVSENLGINLTEININLFSNFILEYFDSNNQKILFRKLFTITNPDSYQKVSNRFIDRLNELKLSDLYLPIKDLIDNLNINSCRSLNIFMESLIRLVVKDSIELHGNYRYLWKEVSGGNLIPISEPETQPIIQNQLKAICDYVGIKLSREVVSGNGKIDFLCSYTFQNNKILISSIELKNAHGEVDHGIQVQLPSYMRSQRTKSGLLLILWYKGPHFNEPKKYESIEQMEQQLKSKKDKSLDIITLTVDCNKPKPPSKK